MFQEDEEASDVKEEGVETPASDSSPDADKIIEEALGEKEEPSGDDVKSQPPQKKDSDHVPRTRLNEELEKRKSLEKELEGIKTQVGELRKPVARNPKDDPERKALIKEYADDHFEGNLEAAQKFVEKQERLNQKGVDVRIERMENVISSMETEKAVSTMIARDEYKTATPYKKDIVDVIIASIPNPAARIHPQVIQDAILIVKGKKFDEAVAEAEKRGSKRQSEKASIVSIGDEEAPAADKSKKSATLTAAQKATAARLGMSEERYALGIKEK